MDIQALNRKQLRKKLEIFNLKSLKVDKVIQPFMTDNLHGKYWIELYQVGKFISLLDAPSKIAERRESPDFIISYNDEWIGLEHESVKDEKIASNFQSTSALFDDAAMVFSEKHPGIHILANIELNVDRLEYRKHEKSALIDIIVDYVYKYLSDNEALKPDFIYDMNVMDHSMVSFNYNPGVHNINQLNGDRLLAAIHKKENKITKYQQNTNIQKQWLLLTIGTYYPDSFEYMDTTSPIEVISDFDRIYLMEDLHGKLWRIK
ncbi:MAG: hypothetical protein Q8903_14860 [Bacteroidota bacterium]|nr:hypothetical protein [Bacteroidota bacterium]